MQDIAARALWLLVKDERSCLAAEGNLLGCDAAKLAAVLAELVEVADAEEVRALSTGVLKLIAEANLGFRGGEVSVSVGKACEDNSLADCLCTFSVDLCLSCR